MTRPRLHQLKTDQQSAFWADGYKKKVPITFDTENQIAKVQDTQKSTARSFYMIMRDEKVYSFENYGLHARARDFAIGVRHNAWSLSATMQEHWEDAQTWFGELGIGPVSPEEDEAIQIAFSEAHRG